MGRRRKDPSEYTEFGRYLDEIQGETTAGQIRQRLARHPELPQLHSSTISNDKHGRSPLTPEKLRAYSIALNVPYEEIVLHWVRFHYGVDFQDRITIERGFEKSADPALHQKLERFLEAGRPRQKEFLAGNIDTFLRDAEYPTEPPDTKDKGRKPSKKGKQESSASTPTGTEG